MPDKRLTHFSLFSGIGGIDLAAEWAGFETAGQCEIDDYATKVLEKNFHNVPRWRDIRDVTAESFRERTGLQSLTLLSGGFPCQPHSLAGKRKASADERDLWSEFSRVIREIRPKWVLGENVRGLLSSESGRFFGRILRDLDEMGYNVGWCCYGAADVGALHKRERVFIVAYANGERELQQKGCEQKFGGRIDNIIESAFANAASKQQQRLFSGDCEKSKRKKESSERGENRKRFKIRTEISPILSEWNPEQIKPLICRKDDGFPGAMDRLRCLGNAVVPQQVYPILETIAEIEKDKACS